MGVFIGTFALIVGLILLIFPKAMSKFLRLGPSSGLAIRKENNKWKVGMAKSVEESLGEKKAVIVLRVLGIICIIGAIFAYISPNAP